MHIHVYIFMFQHIYSCIYIHIRYIHVRFWCGSCFFIYDICLAKTLNPRPFCHVNTFIQLTYVETHTHARTHA